LDALRRISIEVYNRGSLNPDFGPTRDVQISLILSSSPEQIPTKAMTKNRE